MPATPTCRSGTEYGLVRGETYHRRPVAAAAKRGEVLEQFQRLGVEAAFNAISVRDAEADNAGRQIEFALELKQPSSSNRGTSAC